MTLSFRSRFPLFLLSALLAQGLAAPAAAQSKGNGPQGPVAVIAETVQMREMTNRIEALGTLRANESVEIRPKVTGIISEVMFDDGQDVERGAQLVIIDQEIESAVQREAAVALAEARREYDRYTKMVKQGAAPEARLDEQRSKLKLAEAGLAAQTARLGDRSIRAPFTGALGLRRVSPGTLITQDTVITTLDDVSTLKLDFTIPEVHLAAVRENMPIEARSDAYKGKTFAGEVIAVDSRIDPITRSATVRAAIPNKDDLLRPGMLMYVDLLTSQQARLVIPEKSLVPEKKKQFVYVIAPDGSGSVEKREVKLGYRYPGVVEVVEGLQDGETIVAEGTLKIRPDTKVAPIEPEAPKAQSEAETKAK